jgi:CHASE3 domain sensor protein
VRADFDRLKKLTSDNLDQQERLMVLDKKIDARLNLLKQSVALMKAKVRPATLNIVRSDSGKALMDDLRNDIAVLQQAEYELLNERTEGSEASYRTTVVPILLARGHRHRDRDISRPRSTSTAASPSRHP